MPELSEFDLGDYDLCDKHEWAGVGDCPKCVAELEEERQADASDLIERLEAEADKQSTAGSAYLRALLIEAAEALDSFSEAVDALGEIIEGVSNGKR